MPTALREYVRGLGIGAWAVGGSVRDELLGLEHRDEDFVVPGADLAALRAVLERHGRVEEMTVHGEVKGVRLHPAARGLRALAPAGIELAPAPGGGDALALDLARRDFTVNAMARSLDTGELRDPHGGLADLAARRLRVVAPGALQADPLRLLRGLRLVSQLGLAPAGTTLALVRRDAALLAGVAPERVGGGLADDGRGELSLLLLGARPRAALRLARETGVLAAVLPEVAGLPDAEAERAFAAVQAARDAGAGLAVLLAALLLAAGPGGAAAALERLRYPSRLCRDVAALVRAHGFPLEPVDARAARRLLAAHGAERAGELLALRRALLAAAGADEERVALERLAALAEAERGSPHRLADLAVDGADLLALGLPQGPDVGRVLAALLDEVLDDPGRNERGALLARARKLA